MPSGLWKQGSYGSKAATRGGGGSGMDVRITTVQTGWRSDTRGAAGADRVEPVQGWQPRRRRGAAGVDQVELVKALVWF